MHNYAALQWAGRRCRLQDIFTQHDVTACPSHGALRFPCEVQYPRGPRPWITHRLSTHPSVAGGVPVSPARSCRPLLLMSQTLSSANPKSRRLYIQIFCCWDLTVILPFHEGQSTGVTLETYSTAECHYTKLWKLFVSVASAIFLCTLFKYAKDFYEWELVIVNVVLSCCFLGKMMKQTTYQLRNVNETSAMCHHLLRFSLRQTLLIQLIVLKIQHYRVIDSLRTVAWCEYKICDNVFVLQTVSTGVSHFAF